MQSFRVLLRNQAVQFNSAIYGISTASAMISIDGGMVTATGAGAGCGIGSTTGGTSSRITGGSVQALKGGAVSVSPQPKNTANANVYLTTLTLNSMLNKAVTGLTVDGESYVFKDMKTDDAGKLYLWLPLGAMIVAATVESTTYYAAVNVTAGTNNGTLYLEIPTTLTLTADPENSFTFFEGKDSITLTAETTGIPNGETITFAVETPVHGLFSDVAAIVNNDKATATFTPATGGVSAKFPTSQKRGRILFRPNIKTAQNTAAL